MRRLLPLAAATLLLALAGCAAVPEPADFPAVGAVQRENPALDRLIDPGAKVERLAQGLSWAEGPVWVRDGGYLLLSDVPKNRIYRWSAREGLSLFLEPSGLADADPQLFREPGSNGLIPGPAGTILMGDDGNRAVARLDLATKAKTFLATHFEGKKFNSPNDLVLGSDGSIWFTDPPYGLKDTDKSPIKELPFNGVYRLLPTGEVRLVDKALSFPNGIILSPDEHTVYVSVSDPDRAMIYAYTLDQTGNVTDKRVFADMTALVKQGLPGLPDGMAIDREGNLFATGPGGVHVLTPAGIELGLISTGKAVANCTFGEDGRTLFLASSDMLARVRTKTRGLGY